MRTYGALGFALVFALGGCVIVTEPQSGAPKGRNVAGQQAGQPAAATAATATATTTAAPTTLPPRAAPPLDGPKTQVGGKEYVTLKSPVIFGTADNTPGSFVGYVYVLTDLVDPPALDALTPLGVLFTRSFNTRPNPYSTGFPGLDPTLNEHFAIRYEGDFVAQTGGEYAFRMTAEAGAKLVIDSAPVVAASHGDGRGIVRLAPGPHRIRLEYFQRTGPAGLMLLVTPPSGGERPFTAAF